MVEIPAIDEIVKNVLCQGKLAFQEFLYIDRFWPWERSGFLDVCQHLGFPGRGDGYPFAPPTDPDVTHSVIRFLGNQSSGTTLAHNFAAPPAVLLGVVDYSGCRKNVGFPPGFPEVIQ